MPVLFRTGSDEFIEYHAETEQNRLYGKAAA